jgi:hypothetical protein
MCCSSLEKRSVRRRVRYTESCTFLERCTVRQEMNLLFATDAKLGIGAGPRSGEIYAISDFKTFRPRAE